MTMPPVPTGYHHWTVECMGGYVDVTLWRTLTIAYTRQGAGSTIAAASVSPESIAATAARVAGEILARQAMVKPTARLLGLSETAVVVT